MPKRIAIRLLNLVWYGTALLIVLAAVLVATGRELLPQVDFDNEKLARYASEQAGADIRVRHLRSTWARLYPEFTARQITIDTPAFSLRMDNVRMDVDILRSVWRKTPVFDRLEVSQAHIRYTQTDKTTTGPDPEKSWHLVYLLLNKNIHIQNVTMDWQHGTLLRQLQLQDFRLEQTFRGKKVFLRLLGQDGIEDLYAVGELQGDTLAGSTGNIYLKLADWPLHEWLPAADEKQLPALQDLLQQQWHVNGEAWLGWRGKDDISLQANVQARNDAPTSATTTPGSAATQLSAYWQRGRSTVINLHSLALEQEQEQQTVELLRNLRITLESTARWRVQTPALSLDTLESLGNRLPAGITKELLQQLAPKGVLRNIDLQWDNGKPLTARMQLRANAENISTGAWHGVPAFTGVTGYLQSGIGYGFIDLDSRNGFSMFYPEVYREPLQFQRAAGRVQWQWQPEQKTVLVGSDYASLSGEAGEARGNFWLHLPLPGADFHSEMYLAIGLRNSEAKHRETFLPYILPENLLDWLHTSIGNAKVPAAGFIYRGALSGNAPHAHAIQFYADIHNGDLQFDRDWPRLTALNARLLVDDGNAVIRAWGGQLYNSAVEGAAVTVSQQTPGLAISVNARARGYAEDGLRVLRETPLHKVIGSALDSWHMPQGLQTTALQLQIPLAGATVPQQEDVRVSLYDTQLAMDDLKLQFNNIGGDLRYDSANGLQAPVINASLFEKPLTINISSKKTASNLLIDINGNGSAGAADVAHWSNLKPLQMLSGEFSYKAALTVGTTSNQQDKPLGQLQVTSDMTGVSAPLPAPFVAQAGVKKPLVLTVDLYRDNRQDYQLEFNKQLSGALGMRQGQLFGGELVLLGEAAKLPQQAGPLVIRGNLPSGDLQQWLDLITAYNQLPAQAGTTADFYPAFSFTINNAKWKELSFPQLQLSAGHEEEAWRIYFDSGNARGSAFFHDDLRVPEITLSELKLSSNSETARSGPASRMDIDFADVPSMDVRIDQLVYNGMNIGSISTALRSSPDALQFGKLLAYGPGYSVRSQTGNEGAQLFWRRNADGMYQSEFHGLLHMQGEQPALAHLGMDPFVRGENIYLAADLAWPGAPQDIDMKTMSGQVYTNGKKGKYLQVQPNAAMQALSVIDITTWARRLRLDFSDLSNDGISFDEYKGKLVFNNGLLELAEPLRVEGPSSTMTLSGKALLNEEKLDLQLNATLPVGNNATWIAALAGGLPAAAGVYLVSKLFDDQIKNLTSLTYSISGPMSDPEIEFEKLSAPTRKN